MSLLWTKAGSPQPSGCVCESQIITSFNDPLIVSDVGRVPEKLKIGIGIIKWLFNFYLETFSPVSCLAGEERNIFIMYYDPRCLIRAWWLMLGPVWIWSLGPGLVMVRLLVIRLQAALSLAKIIRQPGSVSHKITLLQRWRLYSACGTDRFHHFLMMMLDEKYTNLCVVILRCVICRKSRRRMDKMSRNIDQLHHWTTCVWHQDGLWTRHQSVPPPVTGVRCWAGCRLLPSAAPPPQSSVITNTASNNCMVCLSRANLGKQCHPYNIWNHWYTRPNLCTWKKKHFAWW